MLQTHGYDWRRNLKYMAMAFYRPNAVITALLAEDIPLYSIIPFVIYLLVGWLGTLVAVLWGTSPEVSVNPFPTITHVAPTDYYRLKFVLYPLLNLAALCVFVAIAWLLTRLSAFRRVSVRKATLFLMFLSTIGIVTIIVESLPIPMMIFTILMPLVGMIAVAYLSEFVRRQGALRHYEALLFSLISLTCCYMFRALAMR